MATEILAAGTAPADSTDVTVASGSCVTVFLKTAASGPIPSDANFDIKAKSVGLTYHHAGKLTGVCPAMELGPGIWRVSRVSASSAVGVDQS